MAKLSKQGQISRRKRHLELRTPGVEEEEITGVKTEVLEAEVEDVVVKVEMITKTTLPASKIGEAEVEVEAEEVDQATMVSATSAASLVTMQMSVNRSSVIILVRPVILQRIVDPKIGEMNQPIFLQKRLKNKLKYC